MEGFNQREYQTVVLAALLHDVGKFYQRGLEKRKGDHQQLGDECFEQCFAEKLSLIFSQDEIGIIRSAINNHHGHTDFVTHADWISAGMDRIKLEDEEKGDPSRERLQSVFEKVSLGNNDKKTNEYTYHLKALSINNKNELFPKKLPEQDLKKEYESLWEGFVDEFKNIPTLHPRSYLNALYALLQKYTWCIPSATYKDEPDISLFDHAKTTAAIAGCLYCNEKLGKRTDKDFLLVAGDISGIQKFIYSISKSQGVGGISKKLRGRSFYLLLLQDVIAKYIIEKVGLFTTNILFCGGGRFELLLPNTKEVNQVIEETKKDVNEWLFKEHGGDLGLVLEKIEADRNDFADYSRLLLQLNDKLAEAKKRKFLTSFNDDSFCCEKADTALRICKVCNISRVDDDKKPCKLCEEHKNIGSKLPHLKYPVFATEKQQITGLPVAFNKFGIVYLVDEDKTKDEWLKSIKILDIQRVNNLSELKTSFIFIGNTAPTAKESFSMGNDEEDEDKKVETGNVLSFEMIADASIGDKRIGILKMDVDYLGLIFAIGLEDKRKSISRISTLSRSMDIFFGGYINKICDKVYGEWKNNEDNKWEHKNKVNQIFYIVYSGGDDLLIVGPWSEMPSLAKAIRDEFKEYTCHNPDINISGGIFLCKPKYPISLAAKAGGEELETSKGKGRKRITLFGDTVEWAGKDNLCFDELLLFGEDLYQYIISDDPAQKLPRGFVHGLLRKYRQYNGGKDYRFIPAIIYQLARNVKNDELKNKLKTKLINDKRLFFKHIKIPASYALLKSRKEG